MDHGERVPRVVISPPGRRGMLAVTRQVLATTTASTTGALTAKLTFPAATLAAGPYRGFEQPRSNHRSALVLTTMGEGVLVIGR